MLHLMRPYLPAHTHTPNGTHAAAAGGMLDDLLGIRLVPDDCGIVLALSGELDISTVPALEQRLSEVNGAHGARLLVDLSELQFIDSTGIAAIIRAQASADERGYKLTLRRGTSQIQRLFDITGISERFTFET
jgi:anti-sigma B factor antagonist